MDNSAEYAKGLRLLADWVEANPNMELPSVTMSVYSLNSKEDAAKCLLAMKPCKKEYSGSIFNISKEFGPLTLRYVFMRDAVCTKKQVGTKVVPERVEPAVKAKEEEVIPEHEEPIYEWECEPILGEKGEE